MRPRGAVVESAVNVRVVSATQRPGAEVAAGRFRQDLFYRLNVIQIRVPPLRERLEDLPGDQRPRARAHRARCRRLSRPWAPSLRRRWETLSRYAFPGNVRELENLLHRAGAGGRQWIDADELGLPDTLLDDTRSDTQFAAIDGEVHARAAPVRSACPMRCPETWLPDDEVERAILLRALEKHRYNRTCRRRSLGLSLRQIRYRMARLGITAGD